MLNSLLRRIGLLLGLCVFVALTPGCGDSAAPTSAAYVGTQSPGDVWDWTLGSTTFSATNKVTGYTYSGSKSSLASGFLKLVVTMTTDPGLTPPATAYAVEFPNTALLVQPAGTGPRVIVAASAGTCPTTAGRYNWVTMPKATWTSADEGYGTADTTISAGVFNFNVQSFTLANATVASYSQPNWTCANGTFTNASSSFAFALAPSGIFVGDEGTAQGGMIGVNAPAANVDLAAVIAQNYRGFQFSTDTTTVASVTEPIGGEPGTGANAGKIVGFCYTDVETGTRCPSAMDGIISLTAQPSPGLVTGTIDSGGGGSRPITFVISQVGGRYVVFGVTVTGSGKPYNFMVIQQ